MSGEETPPSFFPGENPLSHISLTPTETGEETGLAIDTHKHTPILRIKHSEVQAHSGSGDHLDVIQIEIERTDGPKAVGRFWIDVHFDNQGRPVLHIATNNKHGKGECTDTKKLRGSWR